jgi:hypothetical protein
MKGEDHEEDSTGNKGFKGNPSWPSPLHGLLLGRSVAGGLHLEMKGLGELSHGSQLILAE